jgi:hypothetical protein
LFQWSRTYSSTLSGYKRTVSEEFLLEAERVMRQSGVVRTVGCAAQ